MDNDVTIIVGAGAVLDFDHRGIIPTVNNITEEVLELPVQKVDGGERQLIKELYDFMAGRLKLVGNPEVRRYFHPKITFEELLHIIEMCLSYSSCWHDEYLHWESFPLFGTLTEPGPFLKSIDAIEYERAANILEEKVMEIINQYDSSFKNNAATESWYRRFWSSLRGRNIFTLNYDSTIEESLVSYEDGFEKHGDEKYYRFSARKYFRNADTKTTIAHLHGSILYSEPKSFPYEFSIRDLVKNDDYESACRNRMVAQSVLRTQANEGYVQPYVISGSRKTEKMVCAPYNVYLSDLTRKVLENKRMIIIGYSFGDLYLNEILGLGITAHGDEFKVLIIDKFPPYVEGYTSFLRHLCDKCHFGEYSFISRVVKDRLHVEPGQKDFPLLVEDCNTPVFSKNGNLMMCLGGFKDAVEKHSEAIRKYLDF